MSAHSPPPSKRCKSDVTDPAQGSKENNDKKSVNQPDHKELQDPKHVSRENEDKDKILVSESSRRENVLLMRLATKEQEVQDYAAKLHLIKKTQEDAALLSLRQANLDPGVNLLFGKMREELQQTKDKLEQAQSELSAWKFTPDSQNGKKLISRCRTLIAENQELGRQLSQGKSAQLEAELALQKKYSEELKDSQNELNEFVIQLDEEVEGMQSTIQVLQQKLASAKRECEEYKKVAEQHENYIHSGMEVDSYSEANVLNPKDQKDYRGHHYSHIDRTKHIANDYNSGNGEIDRIDIEYCKKRYSRTDKKNYSDANKSCAADGANLKRLHCVANEDASVSPTGSDVKVSSPRIVETEYEKVDEYSDDSNSFDKERSEDAWENRTKSSFSDHSSNEDIEIENEEITDSESLQDDSDAITAHISAASPKSNHVQNNQSDEISENLTKNGKENYDSHSKSYKISSETYSNNLYKTLPHDIPGNARNSKQNRASLNSVFTSSSKSTNASERTIKNHQQ